MSDWSYGIVGGDDDGWERKKQIIKVLLQQYMEEILSDTDDDDEPAAKKCRKSNPRENYWNNVRCESDALPSNKPKGCSLEGQRPSAILTHSHISSDIPTGILNRSQ
jgi:hypothetical protein